MNHPRIGKSICGAFAVSILLAIASTAAAAPCDLTGLAVTSNHKLYLYDFNAQTITFYGDIGGIEDVALSVAIAADGQVFVTSAGGGGAPADPLYRLEPAGPLSYTAVLVGSMTPAATETSLQTMTGLDFVPGGPDLFGIETNMRARIFDVPTVAPVDLTTLVAALDLGLFTGRAHTIAVESPTSAWFLAATDHVPGPGSSHTNSRTLWRWDGTVPSLTQYGLTQIWATSGEFATTVNAMDIGCDGELYAVSWVGAGLKINAPAPGVQPTSDTLFEADPDVHSIGGFSFFPAAPPCGPTFPVPNAGGPYELIAGDSLTLDASLSSDVDTACGDTLTYAWDLDGDGINEIAAGNGPVVTVPWGNFAGLELADPDTGIPYHEVTLTITDSTGQTASTQTIVTIYGIVSAELDVTPERVECGGDVTLDASGSSHPGPLGEIVRYEFDFDYDGGVFTADIDNGANPIAEVPGVVGCPRTYAVRVTDSQGHFEIATVGNAAPLTNTAPVADAGADLVSLFAGGAATPVVLDATASFDPDAPCDQVIAYMWDLDQDGNFDDAEGATPDFAPFDGPGAYVVCVRVWDIRGESDADCVTVEVSPDSDFDGIADALDNCPAVSNDDQADEDGDETGDVCDPCPSDSRDDEDEDGLCAGDDNCSRTANPDQEDANGDGFGDACVPLSVYIEDGCTIGRGPVFGEDVELELDCVIGDDVTLGDSVVVMIGAVVGTGSTIDAGTIIGPLAEIGEEAQIGANTLVYARVEIGDDVQIGDEASVREYARIDDGVRIGDRSLIFTSAQIGFDCDIGSDVYFGSSQIGPAGTVADEGYVGHGDVIGASFELAPGAAIANRGTYGNGVRVGADRIVWDNVVIGNGVVIDAVTDEARAIDYATRIGDGTHVGVDAYTLFGPDIGAHNEIGDSSIIAGTSVGDGNALGAGVILYRDSQLGDDNAVGDGVELRERVQVGDHNVLGAGVIAYAGATLGAGSFLASGASIGAGAEVGDDTLWVAAAAAPANVSIGARALIVGDVGGDVPPYGLEPVPAAVPCDGDVASCDLPSTCTECGDFVDFFAPRFEGCALTEPFSGARPIGAHDFCTEWVGCRGLILDEIGIGHATGQIDGCPGSDIAGKPSEDELSVDKTWIGRIDGDANAGDCPTATAGDEFGEWRVTALFGGVDTKFCSYDWIGCGPTRPELLPGAGAFADGGTLERDRQVIGGMALLGPTGEVLARHNALELLRQTEAVGYDSNGYGLAMPRLQPGAQAGAQGGVGVGPAGLRVAVIDSMAGVPQYTPDNPAWQRGPGYLGHSRLVASIIQRLSCPDCDYRKSASGTILEAPKSSDGIRPSFHQYRALKYVKEGVVGDKLPLMGRSN